MSKRSLDQKLQKMQLGRDSCEDFQRAVGRFRSIASNCQPGCRAKQAQFIGSKLMSTMLFGSACHAQTDAET